MSAYENLTDPNTYIARGRPQSEPMFTESDWRPCNVPLLDRLKTILCLLFKFPITYFLFEIELWDLLSSYYCNCFSGNINWIWFILNKSMYLTHFVHYLESLEWLFTVPHIYPECYGSLQQKKLRIGQKIPTHCLLWGRGIATCVEARQGGITLRSKMTNVKALLTEAEIFKWSVKWEG